MDIARNRTTKTWT